MALVYQDADFPALRRLAGGDPRLSELALATGAGRQGRTAEIASVVEEHLIHLTRAEIHERATAERLPLGPVLSIDDLVGNPHVIARDFLRMVSVDGMRLPMPRLPVLWNGEGFAPGPVPVAASPMEVFA